MTPSTDNVAPAATRIAEYAASIRFEDLSELAITRARQVILDFVGTALGGYQTELGKRVGAYAAEVHKGSDATIIGDGRQSLTHGAAWANAILSCVLGMSETHRVGGHIASELVPVALALGEKQHVDGRRIILAIAAGYDVFGLLQPLVKKYQRERGFDHKGHVGTLASAITGGLVLGLDRGELANSIALSADLACGTEQYTFDAGLCDTEGLIAGFGASNGVQAAYMAKFGFRGPPRALEGPYGYLNAYGEGFEPSMLDSLGKNSILATTGFKPHSGCRHVHACVDATQDLLMKARPPLHKIVAIKVGTYLSAVTPEFRCNHYPADFEAAGYSLPATVSVVLSRGSWYREDIQAYDEPEIQRLRQLVQVQVDEDIEADYPEKNGCIVTVVTNEGETFVGRTDYPKGEPENMLTDAEFESKFLRLTGDLIPTGRIHNIFKLIHQFEDLEDVSELLKMTAK